MKKGKIKEELAKQMGVRRDRPSRGALLKREREIEKGRGRITGDEGNKENRKRKRITGDKCDKGQGFAEGGLLGR